MEMEMLGSCCPSAPALRMITSVVQRASPSKNYSQKWSVDAPISTVAIVVSRIHRPRSNQFFAFAASLTPWKVHTDR